MFVNVYKYSNITLFLLLLNYAVFVTSTVATPQKCTELNTEYKSNGPRQPKTCSTRNSMLVIGGKGVAGCFCKPGFILNVLKECIPINKCDACGIHEYYSNCKNYPCRDTCAGNWSQTCSFSQGCYPGCACEDGHIRNDQGVCVLRSECPNAGTTPVYDTDPQEDVECPRKNEYYSSCGPCEPSCTNRNPTCTDQCRAGCFCKPGFVRKDGVCVSSSACRVTRAVNGFSSAIDDGECSGENEHYSECGTCEPTCEEPTPMCTQQCRIGCFCLTGFVRNNGKCISPSECPNKCGKNEVYSTCGTCERTCETPTSKCTDICRKGCFCKDGYARYNGRCIPVANCRCNDPNAEVVSCPNPCQGGTCMQKDYLLCRVKCLPKGCQCKKGFVKVSDSDTTCIAIDDYPETYAVK